MFSFLKYSRNSDLIAFQVNRCEVITKREVYTHTYVTLFINK